MGEYSKARTIIILLTLVTSIIFEVFMVSFMKGYFDAFYKVVIGAIISYVLFLYIVVFGGVGIYCLVASIVAKEKKYAFSFWLILVAVIIGLGMYCYFSREPIFIMLECLCVIASAISMFFSMKSLKQN